MRRSRLVSILAVLAVVLCAGLLAACSRIGYDGDREVPDAVRNDVLFIERNRLSFALGMDIDDADVIARCNCTFTGTDGSTFAVTKQALADGTVEYENFELGTVGSNKQIRIAYNGAVNYIYYDVNDYTVNFFLDEEQTELYRSVKASARLTDTLGLSVWVNLISYNYSTDETVREYDVDRAMRFDGWFDASSNRVTGLYPIAPPTVGNERVVNFHAHYITQDALDDLVLSYDNMGNRVFSGYLGTGNAVPVPEGVTKMDLAEIFKNGCSFETLYVPSTAKLDMPIMSGIDSSGLKEITVSRGNLEYASYNGALYSKDYTTLYFMPSDNLNTEFNSALVEIGSYACAYWHVADLDIPEHVATLQHYCFAYSSMRNVRGLENVKTIKTGVFFGSNIQTFTDGGIARYIMLGGADSGKYILSMMLDDTVTSYKVIDGTVGIAGGAFSHCTSLVSVDLGTELKSIGVSAFSGCTALESIEFPQSLESLGASVFYGCTALKTVTGLTDVVYVSESGNEYAHTLAAQCFYGCSALSSIVLPDGMAMLASQAFYGCSSLEYLDIPDSVVSIGGSVFFGAGLKTVSLPKALRSLGRLAFSHSKLEQIDLSVCTNLKGLEVRAFEYTRLTEVAIPEWITDIPEYCFYAATSLARVDLCNVTTVGQYAFGQCGALVEVDFGVVEHIGFSAFRSCKALPEVVLPDTVKTIGGYAFASDAALKRLVLGKNVETFGTYTFLSDGETFGTVEPVLYGCNKLAEITVAEGNPNFVDVDGVLYGRFLGGKDFGTCGVLLCVPPYYAKTTVATAETTRVIVPYGMHNQMRITAITLNEGLENIGKAAFYQSVKLKSVTVPSTVTHIGASILLSCKAIESFAISENNTTYSTDGNLVYKGDDLVMYLGLKDGAAIKDGTVKIESAVFMNNAKITELIIPDSVVEIGEKAFNGCANLGSIHIGSGLRYLDPTAFAALKSLETITVSNDNPYFVAENNILYTKDGKTLVLAAAGNGMTELDIKPTVTAIRDWAFAYHKTIESVIMPVGMESVGDYAFYECRAIKKLYCAETLETLGDYAFSFAGAASGVVVDDPTTMLNDALQTVLLFGNIKRIGDNAFYGQYGIKYTFFKMTYSQVYEVISRMGKNGVYLTRGCPVSGTGTYYNNGGLGIIRALYSAVEPTIDYDGYEYFYFDENNAPMIYKKNHERYGLV